MTAPVGVIRSRALLAQSWRAASLALNLAHDYAPIRRINHPQILIEPDIQGMVA
jgi:hypothetical protein